MLIVLLLEVMNLSYTTALIIISIISLIFLLFVFKTSFPVVSIGFKFSMAFKVLIKPAILVAALAQFCYTSLDTTMGTWIKKNME